MKRTTITIKVTVEQKQQLKQEADKDKRTLSNYIKVKLGLL
ncbi:hypothetical protein [Coleofasciculus chthonoplastes]|jgi:uncharacterized protein (DUF1778 family)|uniref:Uncharacterized protein n=1 Tax=Coleofasciculus chthonoplastes PCC 7420 TaxID=118168 RepID=B4VKS4_9CYAN|nr:hypothetical protein [Coleofasciculus chthonoplastes]EDX77353.1 hypothetical protein MC7420_490 [Coleofasciculus chthonoplastes PCC 7420]